MSNRKKSILIVDDEQDILEFLSYNLSRENYRVNTACNGKEAVEMALEVNPDLILLDLMMPEMDGIEVCQVIRKNKDIGNTLIAILSARAESYSQIAGFEAGADDYIVKPIRPRLLISRVNALLKRSSEKVDKAIIPDDDIRIFGNLLIDIGKHLIVVDKKDIMLPNKEFRLLKLLTSIPSKVFTRDEIYQFVWGENVYVCERTIDVYIRKLREKIGQNRIKTIKSVGYSFEV
ncbi:MAG: response regulator transcription factor [Bacteroidales bacterium]|nr:response regulator transcription factor [Bacteroidales bacterium]